MTFIIPEPDLELTSAQAELILDGWLGGPVTCTGIEPLDGGMVNSVFRLRFDRAPHVAVVKLHGPLGSSFEREARALRHLREETTCPVPEVYVHDGSGVLVPPAYLLLECIPGVCLDGVELGPEERAGIDAELAAVLAALHDHRGSSWLRIGTDERWASWPDAVMDRLSRARAHPNLPERLSADVLAEVDIAIGMAGPALSDPGPPTLVHGDIWDGNLMVERRDGRWHLTGVLDPNLQFADVELELAYLEVFDHTTDTFFSAYTEHHRLRPGYSRRRRFYWLHTALVHVGLFGDPFFCEYTARIAAEIAADPS